MRKTFSIIVLICVVLIGGIIYFEHSNILSLSGQQLFTFLSLLGLLSTFFGILGFNFVGITKGYRVNKKNQTSFKEIKSRVIRYFSQTFNEVAMIEKMKVNINQNEDEILRDLLSKVLKDDKSKYINSLILAYYCKKSDENPNAAPDDFHQLKRYSESLGIGNQSIDSRNFFEIFAKVYPNYSFKDILDFENLFIKKYWREGAFRYFESRLDQKQNLISTLRRIINEGKMSTWGIKESTISQIETELRMKTDFHNSYLILGQNLRGSIEEYFKTIERAQGVISISGMKYKIYVAISPNSHDKTKFLEEIRKKYSVNGDSFMWVIPIDILKSYGLSFPENHNFSKQTIKRSYQLFEELRDSIGISDSSVIWSVISKSKVTVSQLLSVIPFNIFCPNIKESESNFLISFYEEIKKILSITSLKDFRNESPEKLAKTILKFGKPTYNIDELLELNFSDPVKDEEVNDRFLHLSEDIVKNSKEYCNAIEGYE